MCACARASGLEPVGQGIEQPTAAISEGQPTHQLQALDQQATSTSSLYSIFSALGISRYAILAYWHDGRSVEIGIDQLSRAHPDSCCNPGISSHPELLLALEIGTRQVNLYRQ